MARYTLEAPLGKGGMGVVYRAIQEPPGRAVAVKLLSEGLIADEDSRKRFAREAEACTKLWHPNIIKVLDHGEISGRPFLAMELLEGAKRLDELVAGSSPMPVGSVHHLMDQLLDALDYCHQRGFIHRDVKPSNIMVETSGRLVLMDFGLVKPLKQSVITRIGQVVGTPRYTAPEVLRGHPPTPASDLFGAGAVFYELLTGRQAFDGASVVELVEAIVRKPHTPASAVRPDLPASTEEVLGRLLAKDPASRFPGAAAAREAMEAWKEGLAPGRPGPAVVRADAARVTGRTGVPVPTPRRRVPVIVLALALTAACVLLAAILLGRSAPGAAPIPATSGRSRRRRVGRDRDAFGHRVHPAGAYRVTHRPRAPAWRRRLVPSPRSGGAGLAVRWGSPV